MQLDCLVKKVPTPEPLELATALALALTGLAAYLGIAEEGRSPVSLVSLGVAFVVAVGVTITARAFRRAEKRRARAALLPPDPLATQLERVRESIEALEKAAGTTHSAMQEIDALLRLREAMARKLEADAERAKGIVGAYGERAEEIARASAIILQAPIADFERRSGRAQWLFFVLGLSLSFPIGILVNQLTK